MMVEISFKGMFSFRDEAVLSCEADGSKNMESYYVAKPVGKYQERDPYSEIHKTIKKVSG